MNTPTWFLRENIIITLDARPLLAQGIHPLEMVQNQTAAFLPGQIFEILTPFPPHPMIDKMSAAGFDSFSQLESDGVYHTWFCKK